MSSQPKTDPSSLAEWSPMLVDRPLTGHEVLADDKFGRAPFARTVANVLSRVSGATGLVVSIEGVWGSGKTTTLSAVEEVLRGEPVETRPLIVHFNPWLVGERDALLRQFLGGLASQVKLGDPSKDGKRVAKQLKTYARAFDVLKLIPGAEPWASIVKSAVDTVGDAVGSIADYKAPDIEVHKNAVAERLRRFKRRIIVMIDDMDRLFPLEVFEMIRIIKAVGDLPNVGYVVAWDPKYVREALSSVSVPVASTYLDKIVQVRLPLPSLPSSAKVRLIDTAILSLPPEAREGYFNRGEERLSLVYYHGLRKLLEQPRDIARVFAAVQTIEPGLRGELVLSDIIGFCTLMVLAQEVFELLKTQPQMFVGEYLDDGIKLRKNSDIVKAASAAREKAIKACRNPSAVRELVQFLFPLVAEADGEMAWPSGKGHGHLCNPARLAIALQLSVVDADVSYVSVRRYLLEPEAREGIGLSLSTETFLDFLDQLGDFVGLLDALDFGDVEALCLAIARLVDGAAGVGHARNLTSLRTVRPEVLALHVIDSIVRHSALTSGKHVAASLSTDFHCLSVASYMLVRSYATEEEEGRDAVVVAEEGRREELIAEFARSLTLATTSGKLFDTARPSSILWALSRVSPPACPQVFEAAKKSDPSLDRFALALLSSSYDSNKGEAFSVTDDVKNYVSLRDLKAHATERLRDDNVTFPVKAAWMSVVTDSARYGVDGTEQN